MVKFFLHFSWNSFRAKTAAPYQEEESVLASTPLSYPYKKESYLVRRSFRKCKSTSSLIGITPVTVITYSRIFFVFYNDYLDEDDDNKWPYAMHSHTSPFMFFRVSFPLAKLPWEWSKYPKMVECLTSTLKNVM